MDKKVLTRPFSGATQNEFCADSAESKKTSGKTDAGSSKHALFLCDAHKNLRTYFRSAPRHLNSLVAS